MFEKVDSFFNGLGSGLAKGLNEMTEEAKKKRPPESTAKDKYEMLKKRVIKLEAEMKTAMELIASLQKEAMGGIFEESEPEEEHEEPS